MCVALPSTYHFMEKVIDELLAMYKDAGAPISTIHIGGDEVPKGTWKLSPISNKLIAEDDKLNSTDDLWVYYFDKMKKNTFQTRTNAFRLGGNCDAKNGVERKN